MNRIYGGLAAVLIMAAAVAASAQDVTIVNARIVVGDGPVIERGAIVVRGGHIVSVSPGEPPSIVGTLIDARGMTAVPGFMDGHKHINTGPLEKEQMADLIENGFTTVLSGGGPADGNLTLVKHIESGLINGPHVIPSGRFNLHGTPEQARVAIRAMAVQGIKFTAEVGVTPVPTATPAELAVLRAAVEEGQKDGVEVLVHAVSTPAMVAATEAGVRHQVHLPNKDFMSFDDAKLIADSGTHVLDLISFGAPIIDVFQKDDIARFRTGLLWPESIAGANRDEQGRATGTEGAYTLINARRIWDATNGRGLGYGSDQNYPVHEVLEHELKSMMVMFSMQDVIRILTINTASFLNLQNEVGTLEPLKRADIVLVQGNPFENFEDLLKTVVVLKDGKVVVDKRASRAAPGDLGSAAGAPASDDPMVGAFTVSVARPDQPPAIGCQELNAVRLAQGRVTGAEDVAASLVQEPATPAKDRLASSVQVSAHCVVSALLKPTRGANIRLQLWLPSSDWNGSLLVLGDGNPMSARSMTEPLTHGYAVATTETGRQGARVRPQQRDELARRAAHESAVQSKALIEAYYHGSPRYSYWISGPNRSQTLSELQMNPVDFDGVVVGGPAASTDASAGSGSPDLSAFARRGGKVVEFHGGGAQAVPTGPDVEAYESVVARSGGLQQTKDFYRLFLLPVGQRGDTFVAHWVLVLDQWVQRNRAPDVVLADHLPPSGLTAKAPPGAVVFEPTFGVRTTCAYPAVARLAEGRGEVPNDWLCLPGPRGTKPVPAQ